MQVTGELVDVASFFGVPSNAKGTDEILFKLDGLREPGVRYALIKLPEEDSAEKILKDLAGIKCEITNPHCHNCMLKPEGKDCIQVRARKFLRTQ